MTRSHPGHFRMGLGHGRCWKSSGGNSDVGVGNVGAAGADETARWGEQAAAAAVAVGCGFARFGLHVPLKACC